MRRICSVASSSVDFGLTMFDSHAHLNFNAFKEDAKEIIKDCLDKNIRIINVGSQYDTSLRAVKMARKHEGIYAAIGLHPIHLSQMEVEEEDMHFKSREERFERKKYEELLIARAGRQGGRSKECVVAIGEIGLDYFHIPKERDLNEIKKNQKENFIKQLEFARDINLPVILHCRGAKDDPFGAYNEMIDILNDFATKCKKDSSPLQEGSGVCNRGVIHCFGANLEIAEKFLSLGFYIGFTGIITFKNASSELLKVVRKMPLNRILVETDCPYLAPEPHRGKKCIPQYVEFALRKVAELKEVSFEEAEAQTDKNVEGLFNFGL